MNRKTRLIVVGLVVVLVGVFAVYRNLNDKAPRADKELKRLIETFMKTLPDTTTAGERDEIRGIMDRFYYQAIRGNIAAEDVLAIEADLRAFAAKNGIPAEELFAFMSKVGKATRRASERSEDFRRSGPVRDLRLTDRRTSGKRGEANSEAKMRGPAILLGNSPGSRGGSAYGLDQALPTRKYTAI